MGFRLAWLTNVRHLAGMTILLLLLIPLIACSSDKADKIAEEEKAEESKPKALPTPICPQVAIIRDLEDMRDFGGEKPDAAELVSQAKMRSIDGDCHYGDEGIDIAFNLSFVAAKGPRLGGNHVNFPYFIAVVSPDQTILQKDKLTAEFTFADDKKITERVEPLHITIPLPKDKHQEGPRYQVLLGFQLDKDQLDLVRGRSKN